jgi:hypothetical protein
MVAGNETARPLKKLIALAHGPVTVHLCTEGKKNKQGTGVEGQLEAT